VGEAFPTSIFISSNRKKHLMISHADIDIAAQRITNHVRTTPILSLENGAWGLDAHIVLKLELMQHTGSFKPRGAFNRILSQQVPPAGVIAASGGNHGVAVAYAARQLGHRAEIFVPELCSPTKIERLHNYAAHVTIIGANYAEALAASMHRASETGALIVHAYDQPEVVAGQGTVGRELAQQAGSLDTVLVAVGGGGLIAGIASWFTGKVRVIGVEPENAPGLARALAVGQIVDVDVSGIAADSLGARRVGNLAFTTAQRYVDRVILVNDSDISAAQRFLWQELRLITEPGGATAAATLLSGHYQPAPGERIAVVICGANTDPGQV
jgi:threonine dehydratase